MLMLKLIINFLRNFKNTIKRFLYLRNYRKDTPESTWKFYNKMRYLYRVEFKKRESFNKTINNMSFIETLNKKGFVTLNLTEVSKKKEFIDMLSKFKKKYDYVRQNYNDLYFSHKNKKNYLLEYNFDFNQDVKIIADPFVDIATKYLGTLPILESFQMWYSPNNAENLIGSQLLHRDPEDFRQLKIFIPIEEIHIENGPLNVIDKEESKILYEHLIKKKVIKKRNQKIDDKYAENFKLTNNQILLKNDQCALVDTCSCYHFGSRKASKPRKILFLHFTSGFSTKTPIFRNYDFEKKFSSDKDKLVYGLQKKTINHYKKRQYLRI